MKKELILIFTSLLLAVNSIKAQTGFEQLIKAGPNDATKLVDAYGRPLLKGLGAGMNSGWTNTAKTLGLFHFELRATATAVVVPVSERSFNVTQIGLSSNIRPANLNQVITPTFSGDKHVNGPAMDIYDTNGNKLTSFNMPGGLFEDVVPTPQLQFTLGLFQNTDVTVRAFPKVKLNKGIGSVSMIGFGIKHNLIQDFSAGGNSMPFDFALAFNYSRLHYSKKLNLQPEDFLVPSDPQESSDFSTQEIYGNLDNYLFQAIFSKEFSFFTPYISAGYNISKTELGLKGNYPIINGVKDSQISYTTFADPVNINATYIKGFRADMGFQLKFPVLTLFASYGVANNYKMLNAGIGFGW
ncbi:DUF6588 family protein [Pedobacter cryoconitis]|uniref:Uncharacterized protein n=1 Tax=Pedobacter cryoconitis TaxID=188932 RepID=A0A327T069_9SPHI|nr:DUF6588 family protein [Pedobacter cryoconitis]RAJ33083.1 hypothetical protein LY11_01773 [Pedobacter cryoconitis]